MALEFSRILSPVVLALAGAANMAGGQAPATGQPQPAGGERVWQESEFSLSITPGTVTVNCPAPGCRARIGARTVVFAASATASDPKGKGGSAVVYFYIDRDGSLSVGYDGVQVANATVNGLKKVQGITSFPPGSIPIGHCKVEKQRFEVCADDRAVLAREIIDPNRGIIVIQNPATGHGSIATDPGVVGLLGSANTWSKTTDFSRGTVVMAIVAKKSAYTATITDFTILCDTSGGDVTITLPLSPIKGQMINVKNIGAHVCTLNSNGKNIDGSAGQTIPNLNGVLSMQFDGTTWRLL